MAHLRRRPGQHALLAARSDHARQFQEPADRVAVQDRQPGSPPRIQPRVHAFDGEGRPVRDGWHQARRRGAESGHRRAALDALRRRGPARRSSPSATFGTRARVLERWQAGADSVRDTGLPAQGAGCEDRRAGGGLREGWRRRSEARERSADGPDHRRDRAPRGTRSRGRRHRHRRRTLVGRHSQEQEKRERLRARLRRAHREASLDLPHDSEAR